MASGDLRPTLMVDDNADLRAIVAEIVSGKQGDDKPFLIADPANVLDKFDLWKAGLPNVDTFYAMKCNDTDGILLALMKLGVGFDCASKGELTRILKLGVTPDRLIYANPCKSVSDLQFARANGIDLMTFDNESELCKVKQVHPEAKLVLRILCEAKNARALLGSKFGADANSIPELLHLAYELDLNVVGVSFHVGTGCGDLEAFPEAIKAARQVFDNAKAYGFDFTLLDLGGGYPGGKEDQSIFLEMAHGIQNALKLWFPVGEFPNLRVIAEPGRFFAMTYMTMVTSVSGRRIFRSEDGSIVGINYFTNDGIYGCFDKTFQGKGNGTDCFTPMFLKDYHGVPIYESSICGPICAPDFILTGAMLPFLDIGDWIIWPELGAYSYVLSSNFNGFPKPDIIQVIRKPAQDMIGGDGVPKSLEEIAEAKKGVESVGC